MGENIKNLDMFKTEYNKIDYIYKKLVDNEATLVELFHSYAWQDIKCLDKNKIFYMYNENDRIWEEDNINSIIDYFISDFAKDIIYGVQNYYGIQLSNLTTKTKERDEIVKKWQAVMSIYKKYTVVAKVRTLAPLIAVKFYEKDFDKKLNKKDDHLSVKNGMINLKTGKLEERNRFDYMTWFIDREYNENIDTSVINDFILDIMNNDKEVVDFIQMKLGYCVTGRTDNQEFMIWTGNGSNGKSLLFKLLNETLGDKIIRNLGEMALKGGQANNDSLYNAKDARILSYNETEDDNDKSETKLNMKLIKQLSGEDTVTTAKKYKEEITYLPKYKLIITTNHKPKVNSQDLAVWRRILLINFMVKYIDNDKEMRLYDKELFDKGLLKWKDNKKMDKLREHLDAMLVWLVKGAIKYYDGSIKTPNKIKDWLNKYEEECDEIKDWMEDNCVIDLNNNINSKFDDLYRDFLDYARKSEKDFSNKKFSMLLKNKKYIVKRAKKKFIDFEDNEIERSILCVFGIKLKD